MKKDTANDLLFKLLLSVLGISVSLLGYFSHSAKQRIESDIEKLQIFERGAIGAISTLQERTGVCCK